MRRCTTGLNKVALSTLHYSGAASIMAPLTRGVGVIFTVGNVGPQMPGSYAPNRNSLITPEFLDMAVRVVIARGFDVVSMDDAHFRLSEGDFDRPFACFTFDGAYRDTREYAYPALKRHNCPFTVYVASDFPHGGGNPWWLKLEKLIGQVSTVEVKMGGVWRRFSSRSPPQKEAAYRKILAWLRTVPELDAREVVADLCVLHAVDVEALGRDLIMTWDAFRDLAGDPLVTIGAQSRSHVALAKLCASGASLEVSESVARVQSELGRPCRHFSYPYGDALAAGVREFKLIRELGLRTAVTTRKGLLHDHHTRELTALPRVALDGDYQGQRFIKVLLSGAPFAIRKAVRKPFGALMRA